MLFLSYFSWFSYYDLYTSLFICSQNVLNIFFPFLQIIGSEERESSKANCDKKMLKVNGSNLNSNNYKPAFNHKASFSAKVSSESSLDSGVQVRVKSDKKPVPNKCSKMSYSITNSGSTEHPKETANGAKIQSFEFSFNPR